MRWLYKNQIYGLIMIVLIICIPDGKKQGGVS